MSDLISRQDVIKEIERNAYRHTYIEQIIGIIENLPSAKPEPLTDKEQRIFLAAMGREMKVCEEVDRNYVREPYEGGLVRVCREIERKVKGALWT